MQRDKEIFIITDGRKRNHRNNYGISVCLKWVIFVAQCFGQMPITGIFSSTSKSLKFYLKSWRFMYCILFCICAASINILYLYIMFMNEVDITQITVFIFHFNTFIITLLFLKLASEWEQLMKKWNWVENSMKSYGYPLRLHTKINIMTAVVLALALIEHASGRIKHIYFSIKCRKATEFLEFYYSETLYPKLFHLLGYSIWLAIPLQIINIQLTFAWTFNDLFIMVISLALVPRFQQLRNRLKLLTKRNLQKSCSIQVWREVREDYNRLCNLTRRINDSISYIVLISFANNLYFVLVQLFNSMRIMENTAERVYFFFSFGFLILRIVCVSLYGARIHEESKNTLSILYSVPSAAFNMEVKRFIDHIKYDNVALNGRKYFYITKSLILRMAGAIVTYELVLIQINGTILRNTNKERNQTLIC